MDRVGRVLVETYRVERLIAEGGMASVYEAAHLRVPKKFAVKFLRPQLATHTEALQRFRREAEIVATLDHPNIAHLVDYNVGEDGLPYIVLEYVHGESLADRQDRVGRFALAEMVRVGTQVAAALDTAHGAGVVHRDLKPENILVRADGVAKVVDFGVAKLRTAPDLTAMHVAIGTAGFMAPEQITGEGVDARADQFALASILYGMLSGAPAFEIDGPVLAQATRILTHHPPELPDVPASVNAVLRRGLAKLPGDRYPSVALFSAALREAAGVNDFDPPVATEFDGALPPLPAERTVAAALGGTTLPMTAVSLGDDESRITAERTAVTEPPAGSELPPLAPDRTVILPTPAVPASQRVTLKPTLMTTAELDALRARARRESRDLDSTTRRQALPAGNRVAPYLVVGIAAGGGLATLVYYLVTR